MAGIDLFNPLFIVLVCDIVHPITSQLSWLPVLFQGTYITSKNYILAWILTNGIFQLFITVVTIYICGYLQYYRLYVSCLLIEIGLIN